MKPRTDLIEKEHNTYVKLVEKFKDKYDNKTDLKTRYNKKLAVNLYKHVDSTSLQTNNRNDPNKFMHFQTQNTN